MFVDSVKKGIPSVTESCNYEHVTLIQEFGVKPHRRTQMASGIDRCFSLNYSSASKYNFFLIVNIPFCKIKLYVKLLLVVYLYMFAMPVSKNVGSKFDKILDET
jgi:hypothetical protein